MIYALKTLKILTSVRTYVHTSNEYFYVKKKQNKSIAIERQTHTHDAYLMNELIDGMKLIQMGIITGLYILYQCSYTIHQTTKQT